MCDNNAETTSTYESPHAAEAFFPPKDVSQVSIDQFNEYMPPLDQLTPREDIAKILYDFAHQHANDALYDAAYMVDLADRLNDKSKRPHVLRSLHTHRELQNHPERERYITSIVHDIESMNKFIDQADDKSLSESSKSAIRIRSAIDYSNNRPISNETWDKDSIPPDLSNLADLAESVNLEAVIVKSAQMLQLLKSSGTPPKERLRTVLAIESTYAPLCELSGFDALAATLLSEANCTRLAMSGNQRYINIAVEYMQGMGEIEDVEEFIGNMPTVLVGESSHEAIVDSAKGYNVHFSHSYSDAEALEGRENSYVDSVSRIKTLGAIARKIQHHEEHGYTNILPIDAIGMTVIADDTESIALLVENAIVKIQSIEGVVFINAPSRSQKIQVKGRREFIETAQSAIEAANSNLSVKQEEHDGGFEAVKITVKWPMVGTDGETYDLPVEIQITHRESRNNARVGADSHTLFKLRKYGSMENKDFLDSAEAIECLQRIRKRKDKLLTNVGYGMNNRSHDNSEELFNEISQAIPLFKLGTRAYELAQNRMK